MSARVNWVYIIPSNAKTLYMYFAVTVVASLFSVPRAEWIRIELPMIINTCAVSVIPRDLHKKWVLKCVGFTGLMPAAIDLLVLTILPN
jgi:hypothetical protein